MNKLLLLIFAVSSFTFSQVIFDDNFESGNLNTVTTSDSIYYIVTTHEDIGGRWFYFRMSGVMNKFLKVRVQNSDVTRAMYSYDNQYYERFSAAESPERNVFQKTYTSDTVYVAYYTPYNYSYLLERINQWRESEFVTVDTVGVTAQNFALHEIIITDSGVPDSAKDHIWIHARTHPGETPSSWHFDGLVEKLIENNNVIDFYRKKMVFHLIPFVNPEGVYFGRSRTNFNYVDLEREWGGSDSLIQEEARFLRSRLQQINEAGPVKVFLNLHSQASPYCTFWIHTAQSTSSYFYRRQYQFSHLNTTGNPYFVPADFRESNLQPYFPEGWLWNNYGDAVLALTYETPYDYYSTGIWVDNDNLAELGARTVYAIAEFLEFSHPEHILLDNKDAVIAGNWTSGTFGNRFFSDDYVYTAKGDGSKYVEFNSGEIQSGRYDVYAWWPNSSGFAYNTPFTINAGGNETVISKTQQTNGGQWNFLSTVDLLSDGIITIKVSDDASSTVAADAVKLIYAGEVVNINSDINAPVDFTLYQNYPNPFNPSTTIRFNLSTRAEVKLIVFNPLGEVIETLIDRELGAGTHEVIFNPAEKIHLASGVYYYNLTAGGRSETKGMVFIK